MRRAWQDMKIDGIVCLGNYPTIYIKRVRTIKDDEARDLQRRVWNQGIASLLVLVSDVAVHVYSGLAVPAGEDERLDTTERLIAILDLTANALAIENLVRSVELGTFFQVHKRCFDPTKRVDRYLLNNLEQARQQLKAASDPPLDSQTVHALLGRVIFTCYLVDREIIGTTYFQKIGARKCTSLRDLFARHPLPKAKRLLYALFDRLRKDFNGDVFGDDLAGECRYVTERHIDVLRRLLSEEDLRTRQMHLGFSVYDFRFIPIETISAIYERFLKAESPDDRRQKGAYYTPRFLAEATLDLALNQTGPRLDGRYLDPACGSGIFLVGVFNRLAERWRIAHPEAMNARRAVALRDLLRSSVFGVDSSGTACRIAALSLYLALLDQLSPRDIQRLQSNGPFLPRLVCHGPRPATSSTDGNNIFHADFFDPDLAAR